MQRAGRRAKKDNTNRSKSNKGSSNANQNVVNINLGELVEKHSTKKLVSDPRRKAKRKGNASKDNRPPKKQDKKVSPSLTQKLTDAKQEYMRLTRSTDMRMLPPGCGDVPDRLLRPTTPAEVQELISYLERCNNGIRLRSTSNMVPSTGMNIQPSTTAVQQQQYLGRYQPGMSVGERIEIPPPPSSRNNQQGNRGANQQQPAGQGGN